MKITFELLIVSNREHHSENAIHAKLKVYDEGNNMQYQLELKQ